MACRIWRSAGLSDRCALTAMRSTMAHCLPRVPSPRQLVLFFSSRRRHTRYWRDWSSDVCSSDLWNEPSVLVELVPAARQPERLGAKVSVVVLAVIADRLDDLVAPVVGDAHVASEFALDAEKRARLRIGCLGLDLVDVGLGETEHLAFEHGEMDPFHQNGPALVALPHQRAEKFARDQLGQDHPVG